MAQRCKQSLQVALKNLDSGFTKFFREKKGFPKFKSRNHEQSFACPQNVKIDFHNSTVTLPKIGTIKTVFSREFKGKVKTCTVSKTRTGKYFISILVEIPENPKRKTKIKESNSVGVDLGIKEFAILSNGEKIDNPKFLRKSEKRLKTLQQRASKKKKGSNNRKKANLHVARKHEKITNQRNDFLHKVSTKLIRENQTICLETLNVSGMMKNHKLAKSIAEVSWNKFVQFLKYKADWYGVNIVQIGRFDPSSKMCSACGAINKALQLKHRKWKCLNCDTVHDRDVNAAINIRNFALQRQNLISPTGSGEGLVEMPVSKPGSMKQESHDL